MEKVKEFVLEKKRILLISLSIICFILLLVYFVVSNNKSEKIVNTKVEEKFSSEEKLEETPKEEVKEIEKEKTIFVDVKGEVKKPGVYELSLGKRVIDAINTAGGLTKNAYTKYINLSKVLSDECVIIVNNKSEIKKIEEKKNIEEIIINDNTSVSVKESEVITNDVDKTKEEVKKDEKKDESKEEVKKEEVKNEEKTDNVKEDVKDNLNTLVNINSASLDELMSINGIGESKAKAIIEYRNSNGLFKSIEEIKNVSGIGDKLYDKIKENITVK